MYFRHPSQTYNLLPSVGAAGGALTARSAKSRFGTRGFERGGEGKVEVLASGSGTASSLASAGASTEGSIALLGEGSVRATSGLGFFLFDLAK